MLEFNAHFIFMNILFLLFTVVPALELYLLFQVGGEIGGANTILLIIGTGILGAALAKSQGLAVMRSMQEKTNKGEMPGSELIDAFLIFGGGLLLLTPGFLTDILGFSMVFPLTRFMMRGLFSSLITKGIKNGNIQGGFTVFTSRGFEQTGSRFSQSRNSQVDPNTFEAEFKTSSNNKTSNSSEGDQTKFTHLE